MKVTFEPCGIAVEVKKNNTLLEAADAAGVEIEAPCAGRGTCAKCKVIVHGEVSPPTPLEFRGLTQEELERGYRLACQAFPLSDLEVTVPEESRISEVSILSEGIERAVKLDPWVHRHLLQVPSATIEDQVSDVENVLQAWRAQGGNELVFTLGALRQLPGALRAEDGAVTLIEIDGHVVYVGAGNAPERVLGMAFDIGTTTVVGYLLDLETGEQLAVSSLLNPQTRYGEDVVSRIDFANSEEGGLELLQREIIEALNRIVADTTGMASVDPECIFAVTVVGNTTMQHLFTGINPEALAYSPYVPVFISPLSLKASELGIRIYPDAQIYTLPNIAGWVGADTVGVLLSTGMAESDEIALAIDIGTNGEMILGSRERIITCSTAAGPAFEGAHISSGMRAATGAIDVIRIKEGDVRWHTIGETAPRGICGSGLVDMVAEMLREGVISSTGMMEDPEELRGDGQGELAHRMRQQGKQRAFALVDASQGAGGRAIGVTQRDVRKLQLAKGAIRAGIEILLKEFGCAREDVKRVYLAGAFGNYIRAESALGIGLIPNFPQAEIIPVGNAAGSGAKEVLLSRTSRREIVDILANVEYLELSARADFQQEFTEAMLF
ncbi:MAG: ASKHA domain-containing protein [Chloroflexota bacterium]|nr:ASKHA domain-containing protein [Chloroflexota bacterium]